MEKIKIGSRVILTIDDHECLKLGASGEVIQFTDQGNVRVVFDASQIGRGYIDEIDPEDLRVEEYVFDFESLHEFLHKEFKKSRPVIPQQFIYDEYDEDDDTDEEFREPIASTKYKMEKVLDFVLVYKSVPEDKNAKVNTLTVAFDFKHVHQFSRLISIKSYNGFTID